MFYGMTSDTVIVSIEHLYKAMELLTAVNNSIVDDPFIDFLTMSEKLSEGWLQVNMCRIYTQHIVDFEEMLVPSMGLINDAKCMLDSLVAWKIGMTLYGKYNILKCIREAGLDHINPVIDELEVWFDYMRTHGDDDGLIQCVSF